MKFRIVLCFLFLSCLSTQAFSASPLGASMTSHEKTYDINYSDAWPPVVDLLTASNADITNIDEKSGLIMIGYTSFGDFWSMGDFWKYAKAPAILLATWGEGRYKATIRVIRLSDTKTKVVLNYQFEALETNVNKRIIGKESWHRCETTGRLEEEFFSRLDEKINLSKNS